MLVEQMISLNIQLACIFFSLSGTLFSQKLWTIVLRLFKRLLHIHRKETYFVVLHAALIT